MSDTKKEVPPYSPEPATKKTKKTDGKLARYHATSKERTFPAAPGDNFRCTCCGKTTNNPYQHHGQCDKSLWYAHLRNKVREAYNFCKFRHVKEPKKYGNPGKMVMMNPEMTEAMMQKVPMSMLIMQDKKWNILMPMRTDSSVVDGASVTGKYFSDHFDDLCKEMKAHRTKVAIPRLKMFEQTPDGRLDYSWETYFDPIKIKTLYTNAEKEEMEKGRAAIWNKHHKKNKYCLFFTKEAGCLTVADKDNSGKQKETNSGKEKETESGKEKELDIGEEDDSELND